MKVTSLFKDVREEAQGKINEDNLKAAAKGDNVLYYDAMCGRLFRSDENTIEKAVNKVNRDLTSGKQAFMSLNEIL